MFSAETPFEILDLFPNSLVCCVGVLEEVIPEPCCFGLSSLFFNLLVKGGVVVVVSDSLVPSSSNFLGEVRRNLQACS